MVNQELNLNNTYYETLDENFKEALKLIERNFSHSELINLLKNGNIPQKQIAALKLDTINSQEEAAILLKNLTGQDGKIREAVSASSYFYTCLHNHSLRSSSCLDRPWIPYHRGCQLFLLRIFLPITGRYSLQHLLP